MQCVGPRMRSPEAFPPLVEVGKAALLMGLDAVDVQVLAVLGSAVSTAQEEAWTCVHVRYGTNGADGDRLNVSVEQSGPDRVLLIEEVQGGAFIGGLRCQVLGSRVMGSTCHMRGVDALPHAFLESIAGYAGVKATEVEVCE